MRIYLDDHNVGNGPARTSSGNTTVACILYDSRASLSLSNETNKRALGLQWQATVALL